MYVVNAAVMIFVLVGSGAFAPLGREGSAFGSSSHLHESCRGAGFGGGATRELRNSTSANTHTLSVDCSYMIGNMDGEGKG